MPPIDDEELTMSGHLSDSGDAWDEEEEISWAASGLVGEKPNDYTSSAHIDEVDSLSDEAPIAGDDLREQIDTLLVTAKNPAGTVSATALMSGRVVRVDLLPTVTNLTESELAEEITVISTLARQQARAAQHSFAAALMRQLGHDPVAARAFLEHEVGLPSPQTVLAEKHDLFSARYRDDS